MNEGRAGYVQIYTGDGKGKTTAAFGLALRATGQGLRAIVVQFMKADATWGEVQAASRLGVPVEQVRLDHWVRKGMASADDLGAAAAGFERAREVVQSGDYDVVILDELMTSVFFELVLASDVVRLLRNKPQHAELVLTGRRAPAELVEAADLVTEMRSIKHYFDRGVGARRGIEY